MSCEKFIFRINDVHSFYFKYNDDSLYLSEKYKGWVIFEAAFVFKEGGLL